MLETKEDLYNGLIINPQSTYLENQNFKIALLALIEKAKDDKKIFCGWI